MKLLNPDQKVESEITLKKLLDEESLFVTDSTSGIKSPFISHADLK